MTWYGTYNEESKQLLSLLSTKPTLTDLLLSSEFIPQLKAYNPSLLEYLTNYQTLAQEIITYVSVKPNESDSVDRKYKLPLLSVDLVESETVCIINSFFKTAGSASGPNIVLLFDMLKEKEVLPLLGGYFGRVLSVLVKCRYQELLETVYTNPKCLELLINHSHHESIARCLVSLICIECTKNIVFSEEKVAIRMGLIRSILSRVELEKNNTDERSECLIENLLVVVLREIIERYFNLSNGKQMLEIILEEGYVGGIVGMMGEDNCLSYSAMMIGLSFLRYYALSSMNVEDENEEQNRKNTEKLENQPFLKILILNFKAYLAKVKTESIDLYSFKLLEVLCHAMTLSSNKVLAIVKESELFPLLIDLIFKNEQCNILHRLIENIFQHIFTNEKSIYEKYKSYLFCEISIIDLTVKRLLETFPDADSLQKAKKKCYFGNIMKIIKIYSSIVTSNTKITAAITAKTIIWNEIAKKMIKPYELSIKEELGVLENIPDTEPVEFKTKNNWDDERVLRQTQNTEALEEVIREEETMPKTLELNENKKENHIRETKMEDDSFFRIPLGDPSLKNEANNKSPENKQESVSPEKKSTSFTEFLDKEKVKVGEEIKMQRSMSEEKRLSADKKRRIASPSPARKKNSWKEEDEDNKEKEKGEPKMKPQASLPKIPTATRNNLSSAMTKSFVEPNKNTDEGENKRKLSLSLANLESLKKTTITRAKVQPAKKTTRNITDKDEAFFAYIGLNF